MAVRPEAGPVHVVVLEVGELLRLFGLQAVAVEVDAMLGAAVRAEINRVTVPHGVGVGARVIRDALVGVVLEIVNGDVLGHAAGVTLPGAKIAEDAVVSDLGAVGRKGGEPSLVDGQALRQAAVDAHFEQAPEPVVERVATREIQNVLAVGKPGNDFVVRSHAFGHRDGIRFEGQLLGLAAVRGHHVDIEVAVVLPREGDPLAVGRKFGERVPARGRW